MFYVGQKVVCVKPAPYTGGYEGPEIGQVYTVRSVLFCPVEKVTGIRLEEITLHFNVRYGEECGFHASRFRPVVEKKTNISCFTEILRRETIDDGPVVAKPRTRKVSAADGQQ